MKEVYLIVLSPAEEGGYAVYIPDFEINTQGETIADAMDMARDAIGGIGLCYMEDQKEFPKPITITQVKKQTEQNDIVTYVDVDFDEYKRKNEVYPISRTHTINYLHVSSALSCCMCL